MALAFAKFPRKLENNMLFSNQRIIADAHGREEGNQINKLALLSKIHE